MPSTPDRGRRGLGPAGPTAAPGGEVGVQSSPREGKAPPGPVPEPQTGLALPGSPQAPDGPPLPSVCPAEGQHRPLVLGFFEVVPPTRPAKRRCPQAELGRRFQPRAPGAGSLTLFMPRRRAPTPREAPRPSGRKQPSPQSHRKSPSHTGSPRVYVSKPRPSQARRQRSPPGPRAACRPVGWGGHSEWDVTRGIAAGQRAADGRAGRPQC